MSQENQTKVSETVTKLSLLAQLLGLLERVLPAFLVAWNNQLKQRNKQLELKLQKKEVEQKVEGFKEAQDDGKNPAQTIDSFLNK